MPSTLSVLCATAALAGCVLEGAAAIPFARRAVFDTNKGTITVQNVAPPVKYDAAKNEPFDHFHFRYLAIGCDTADKASDFFSSCCKPRPIDKQEDSEWPLQCNLDTYLVYDPIYSNDQVVAKLGMAPESDAAAIGVDASAPIITGNATTSDWPSATSSTVEAVSTESAPSNTWTSQESWSSVAATSDAKSQWVESSSTWSSAPTPSWTVRVKQAMGVVTSASSSSWTSSYEAPKPSSSWSSSFWSSSSSWQAPAPSSSSSSWTSQYTPPAPTSSSSEYTPSSSSTPAPAATSQNSGSTGQAYTGGQATYFYQGGNPGACGIYHSDSDYILALDYRLYGSLGVQSQYCGRSVTITNTNTGATATGVVADACPTCSNENSLDLSVGLFQALGNMNDGVLPISWHFN